MQFWGLEGKMETGLLGAVGVSLSKQTWEEGSMDPEAAVSPASSLKTEQLTGDEGEAAGPPSFLLSFLILAPSPLCSFCLTPSSKLSPAGEKNHHRDSDSSVIPALAQRHQPASAA